MTKNFAIAIGINQYNSTNFQPLSYAQSDAELMRDFFQQEARFDEVNFFADNSPNLRSLTGLSIPTYPSTGNLESFLHDRFETPFLEKGDNCWFFFAGHGLQYNHRDYLMPIDANPREVERTGIAIDYIRERLKRSGADNVILVIDACRTKGARNGMGVGSEKLPGVITIYSCSPTQRSWEIAALQQGVFTYALLEALRVRGKENYATAERLSGYLRSRVPALCLAHGKVPEQMPSIGIEPLEKQHFVLVPQCLEPIDMQVDILKMKNDVYRLAFCEKNLDWAKQIWDRLNALTLGKDGEVTAMLQSMTMAGMHLEREAAVQLQLAELQRQFTASQAQVELHRSALQTTKEEHRSALATAAAESALLLATQQEQAEKLERLLAAEQRAGRLLTAKLQDQEKLLAEINRYRLMAAQQVAPSSQGLQLQSFSFEVVTVSPQGDVGKRETKQAEYLTFNLPLGNTLDLVHIPAGQFLMGSPDGEGDDQEKPQHLVTVPDFYLGKYLVTQAQWRSISSLPSVKLDLKPDPAKFKGDLLPVERVSWLEAIEFCARLSQLTGEKFRLPSEAEWEYACRAGTSTPFHFGQTISTMVANYDGSFVYGQGKKGEYREKTTDVGSLNAANGFGLYDMHGNVWEWCADCWHDNYQGAPMDGSAWMSKNDNDYHLLRGGSWFNYPDSCRSAYRDRDDADGYGNIVGFRVVYAPARTV